jgi:DHA1 family tetracycline resistance protein-like MFS transporter
MRRAIRSPLFLMGLTVFIDITGFGLVLPLLPFWAERLGADAFVIGLITTTYALAQFLFTPLLGALSDRSGRRPVILISLLVEAAAFAMTALAGTLPMLLVARFVGGMGASNIGSAQAVVADVTPPAQRARGMGVIGAAIGLGFVVGPALGGLLATLGAATPFWVAMGVALLNALLVWRFLPETRVAHEAAPEAASQPKGARAFAGWRRSLNAPLVARLILINLLFTLAFTAMEAVFALFTQQTFGWNATQNGYVFAYVGVIIVVMQGGLVGRLVKRWGVRPLLIGGLALLSVGLILLPFSSSIGMLLAALGLLSVGEGAVTPTSSALLSLASPDGRQGETLGLSQGIGSLGRIIGPLAAGWLFLTFGASAPFLAGGMLTVVALLVALPAFGQSSRSSGSQTIAAADLAQGEAATFDTPALTGAPEHQ